jgi:hypothetical protein
MWKQEPNFDMATWVKLHRVSKAWEVATKETITEIAVWLEREAEWNRMTEINSPPQDSD